jgi:hypothetical protein
MWYEIHVIMELTLFLYENKECMSLLFLLEKIALFIRENTPYES